MNSFEEFDRLINVIATPIIRESSSMKFIPDNLLHTVLSFDGRASRKEYISYQFWSTLPSVLVVGWMFFSVLSAFEGNPEEIQGLLSMGHQFDQLQYVGNALAVLSQILCMPVTARRLNDMGWNRWLAAVSIVPFLNWVFCTALMVIKPPVRILPDAVVAPIPAPTVNLKEPMLFADHTDSRQ
jgi:uncharacterized membrane protein YhaH (DUF805 family)